MTEMLVESCQKIRIALMSVADIQNYGDTLFPFIARQEILKRLPNAQIRFFTPTNDIIEGETFYGYSRESLDDFRPTSIIVIGGEVIHKYDEIIWHEMYKNIHSPIISNNVSDTFLDWLDYPAFKAWFSVGVLYLNDGLRISDIEIDKLNYVGVRGILSKKNLQTNSLKLNKKINVVPDIGWIFKRYFTDYKMYLGNLENRLGHALIDNKYVIFNINHTSIQKDEMETVTSILNNFAINNNCSIFLLPIIKSYNDKNDLMNFTESHIHLLPDTLTLKEIGSLLMGAWFYIGSSLHAAITTMSNNRNAAIIHNVQLEKLQDLFAHSMRLKFLAHDWSQLSILLDELKKDPSLSLKKYVDFMTICIDEKLDDLCEELL